MPFWEKLRIAALPSFVQNLSLDEYDSSLLKQKTQKVLLPTQCDKRIYTYEVVAINCSREGCIHTQYTKHSYHNHALYHAFSYKSVHASAD
jgi:hypothetical protein